MNAFLVLVGDGSYFWYEYGLFNGSFYWDG
jgi:hypothetical protein